MIAAATAHPAKFPDAMRGGDGPDARPCRRGLQTCMTVLNDTLHGRTQRPFDAIQAQVRAFSLRNAA